MKIEPLVIHDGGGYEVVRVGIHPHDSETPFHIGPHSSVRLSREHFAALVRWGAAALARTHPDRVDADPATCDHRHQHGNAEATVCAKCGAVMPTTPTEVDRA